MTDRRSEDDRDARARAYAGAVLRRTRRLWRRVRPEFPPSTTVSVDVLESLLAQANEGQRLRAQLARALERLAKGGA